MVLRVGEPYGSPGGGERFTTAKTPDSAAPVHPVVIRHHATCDRTRDIAVQAESAQVVGTPDSG